jgi:hypothetical protein
MTLEIENEARVGNRMDTFGVVIESRRNIS